MPASGIDFYIQDARNNFDAVRPAPIPTDDNVVMGQCHNIHISTNCYYGYHDPKSLGNNTSSNDCEMLEVAHKTGQHATARKRSADNADFPQSKRLRQGKIHFTVKGISSNEVSKYLPIIAVSWPWIVWLINLSFNKVLCAENTFLLFILST